MRSSCSAASVVRPLGSVYMSRRVSGPGQIERASRLFQRLRGALTFQAARVARVWRTPVRRVHRVGMSQGIRPFRGRWPRDADLLTSDAGLGDLKLGFSPMRYRSPMQTSRRRAAVDCEFSNWPHTTSSSAKVAFRRREESEVGRRARRAALRVPGGVAMSRRRCWAAHHTRAVQECFQMPVCCCRADRLWACQR